MTDTSQTTSATPNTDISRNVVIGLAEMHKGIAESSGRDAESAFHTHTAQVLRALADQRDYPNGQT